MTVEVSSTEIPTKFAPIVPSIFPEFITSELTLPKIPAEFAPDISIVPVVPLFVTLDFSAIIPTDFSPVIFIEPVFSAKELFLS